jgi:hypothetical protein
MAEKIITTLCKMLTDRRAMMRMKDLFARIDADHNGGLDKKEFSMAVQAFLDPLQVDEDAIEEVFANFDKDNSGHIEYDEFVCLLRQKAAGLKQAAMKLKQLVRTQNEDAANALLAKDDVLGKRIPREVALALLRQTKVMQKATYLPPALRRRSVIVAQDLLSSLRGEMAAAKQQRSKIDDSTFNRRRASLLALDLIGATKRAQLAKQNKIPVSQREVSASYMPAYLKQFHASVDWEAVDVNRNEQKHLAANISAGRSHPSTAPNMTESLRLKAYMIHVM